MTKKTLLTSPPELKIVNHTPDTIFINFKFADDNGTMTGDTLPDEIVEQLDAWQKQSRTDHTDVETSLTFSYLIGDELYKQPLYMRSHGSSMWSWLLYTGSQDISVKMSHGTVNRGLFCQVRYSSHLLHMFTAEECIICAESMLYDFMPLSFQSFHKQVSELHLCCDVQGCDFSQLSLIGTQLPFVSRVTTIRDRPIAPTEEEQEGGLSPQAMVSLEEKIRSDIAACPGQEVFPEAILSSVHRRLATIDFGSHGSDISAQIYNKSLEVIKHKKEWLYPIWLLNGWDGASPVWRIEFRFRRAFLREYELDEAFTVLQLLRLLWEYATYHWLRFVDLDQSHGVNISRLPTHPVWEVIQHAYDHHEETREKSNEQAMLTACVVHEKPFQVLKQSTGVLLHDQLQEDIDQCLLSAPFLCDLLQQDQMNRLREDNRSIEQTLRDEPVELLRELAGEEAAKLTSSQRDRMLARLAPSLEDARAFLIKRDRQIAKRDAALAQSLGNMRSFSALLRPDEIPFRMRKFNQSLPDFFTSILIFARAAWAYDQKKDRTHIEEVQKKQLKYGFLGAVQREEERAMLGVELPKDEPFNEDLLKEDWDHVFAVLAEMKTTTKRQKNNVDKMANIA